MVIDEVEELLVGSGASAAPASAGQGRRTDQERRVGRGGVVDGSLEVRAQEIIASAREYARWQHDSRAAPRKGVGCPRWPSRRGLGEQPAALCGFCGRRCRVPLSTSMPAAVVEAYRAAGLDSLATCRLGAADERARLGASYLDVIEERVRRVREAPSPWTESQR